MLADRLVIGILIFYVGVLFAKADDTVDDAVLFSAFSEIPGGDVEILVIGGKPVKKIGLAGHILYRAH